MKLPEHITGFQDATIHSTFRVDGRQFKKICFEFALQNKGEVISFSVPQYPLNFYLAHVKIANQKFFILLNEYVPYLAFAANVEFGHITFINSPVSHELFLPFYRIVDVSELTARIDPNYLNQMELSQSELKQIVYWRPSTLGEIIFNWWD